MEQTVNEDSTRKDLVQAAADLAEHLLCGDPERLAHSAAVAQRTRLLAMTADEQDRAVLVAAAWVHDIGYSLGVQQTGFHPVDGARYLRRSGWPQQVQDMVAHHSGSRFVARVRQLEPSLESSASGRTRCRTRWTVADQTVGPGGRLMTVEERLADMLSRHR